VRGEAPRTADRQVLRLPDSLPVLKPFVSSETRPISVSLPI